MSEAGRSVRSNLRKGASPAKASGSGMKSVPSASADGTKRVKVVKKPRDPQMIEAEIAELETRAADITNKMSTPEVARDISKLVAANDAYAQTQARLAELYDEWERAESSVSSGKEKDVAALNHLLVGSDGHLLDFSISRLLLSRSRQRIQFFSEFYLVGT